MPPLASLARALLCGLGCVTHPSALLCFLVTNAHDPASSCPWPPANSPPLLESRASSLAHLSVLSSPRPPGRQQVSLKAAESLFMDKSVRLACLPHATEETEAQRGGVQSPSCTAGGQVTGTKQGGLGLGLGRGRLSCAALDMNKSTAQGSGHQQGNSSLGVGGPGRGGGAGKEQSHSFKNKVSLLPISKGWEPPSLESPQGAGAVVGAVGLG